MSHLNMEIIQSLRDLAEPGEPDALKECADLYLSDTPNCIQNLHDSLNKQDVPGFKRAAHTLKGSSSNLGADILASICGQLEDLARAGSLTGAAEIIQQVEKEFAAVKSELEEVCQAS